MENKNIIMKPADSRAAQCNNGRRTLPVWRQQKDKRYYSALKEPIYPEIKNMIGQIADVLLNKK